MGIAVTYSSAELGIEAPLVHVETNVSAGLPQVLIVGLPETAVRESKDRVKAAITNSRFEFPSNRVTVNLAPADLPKSTGRYDLAIAVSILAATDQIPSEAINGFEFLGELSLTGDIRAVKGVLPATIRNQKRTLIAPEANEVEAGFAKKDNVLIASSLSEVAAHLTGVKQLETPGIKVADSTSMGALQLSDVKGQLAAKRALTIAAAGSHNLLMLGPPGTGKTMLASRLPGLLPRMSLEQSLEVISVMSVSNQTIDPGIVQRRPFRAPHHSLSAVAMVGGSSPPKPGEISLAHNGILFLDELPEFSRHVLEVLREPLESGEIFISRAAYQVRYPANFQLIAAMNPCPCGYYGDNSRECVCSAEQIRRYRSRLSGPLLDRIDMHIEVPALPLSELRQDNRDVMKKDEHTMSDKDLHLKVSAVHEACMVRQGCSNSELSGKRIDQVCRIQGKDRELLDQSANKLGISARGYFKILKIARTIADLNSREEIITNDLIEALNYRRLDRKQ